MTIIPTQNQYPDRTGYLGLDTDRNVLSVMSDGKMKSTSIPEGWVNVKDFGAKGDGVTDDTEAIQTAIDSCPEGGTVFFPISSDYNIRNTINIENRSNITLMGGRFTFPNTLDAPMFRVVNSDHIYFKNLSVFVDIDILNDVRNDYGNILLFHNVEYIYVGNCIFNGSKYSAIRIGPTKHAIIENNYINNCLATSIFGGDLSEDIKIQNNTITNSKDDCIFIGNASTSVIAKDCIISNNKCEYCNAKAIGVGGWRNVIIANNIINYTRAPAIDVEVKGGTYNWGQKAKNIKIHDNIIVNAGKFYGLPNSIHSTPLTNGHGIEILGFYNIDGSENNSENISIYNNIIDTVERIGIRTSPANTIIIENNNIQNGNFGIHFGTSDASTDILTAPWIIKNNKIVNTDIAIYGTHCKDAIVNSNLCINSTGVSMTRFVAVDNLEFENNILINNNGAPQGYFYAYAANNYPFKFKNYQGETWESLYLTSDAYKSGTVRPTGYAGMHFFDTSINKLIFFDGTDWRDKNGTIV